MSATILLVEDNPRIMEINAELLSLRGYRVLEAGTIAQGRALFEAEHPDLIILDIMLPDGDGLRFCEELRGGSKIPILFLSALRQNEEMIAGLLAGGDDYMPKPYDINMLAAKVETLLRRVRYADESAEERVSGKLECGSLTINRTAGRAYLDGRDLGLHKKEYELLHFLAVNENQPMSKEDIYQKVWDMPLIKSDQALRGAVSRLRSKIVGCGYVIASVRGVGYRFEKAK